MTLARGTRLGPYVIESPIGAGGMGEVYKAHDPTLQRTVAIKVLAKQDEDASARLLQEARAASALNHPHICTIYEVGEHEGQAFIVMEHVEGQSLSALVPADGLPPESVIRYGTQIADALAHAHERGIVHRDLKSANVVITPEGRAKVLDFGLAARMPQADVEAVTKTQEALPHAGMLVGTLAYMAPEVLRGEAATARSDIWALGVLLYEMASGRLPFGGETVADVVSAILKETPAPLRAITSAGLRLIIHQCLSKESARRYATADTVRAGLELSEALTFDQIDEPSQRVSPPSVRVRERVAWGAAGVLSFLVVGLSALLFTTGPTVGSPQVLTLATGPTLGVYYPIGVGIGEVIEQHLPNVDVEVIVTDGSLDNMRRLDRGEVDLAFGQNDIVFHTVRTDRVLGRPNDELVGLALLYEEVGQVVVASTAAVERIEDLRGQSVSFGLPGSGSRFSSELLFAHFGMGEDDIDLSALSELGAVNGLLTGSLSAMVVWRALPVPLLEDLLRHGGAKLIPIDPEAVEALRMKEPFLVPSTIPARVYANQEQVIPTAAVKAMLVARSTLDPDLVEEILNAIFSSVPALIAHHPRAADISRDSAFDSSDGMPIDLHPGALRFARSTSTDR
jgi:TRAP transporter TAXI family solute receptor